MSSGVAATLLATIITCVAGLAHAAGALGIKPLAESRVDTLPPGSLYWRIENVATAAEAKQLAGPWSLVAESAGKVWLFTLGPAGGSTQGATKVAEVGPIPRLDAPQYLLRINEATGVPGSVTAVHSHPGSEAFYVLGGEQSIRTPKGVLKVAVGQATPGEGAGLPMQVSSSGSSNLHALVMFVVDATRPFSSPAAMD